MTPTEKRIMEALIKEGSEMRSLQKQFFSCRDQPKRRELLRQSLVAEGRFDNVLYNGRQLPGIEG